MAYIPVSDEIRTQKFMIKQYKLRFYNFRLVIPSACDQSVWSAAGSKCIAEIFEHKQLLGVVISGLCCW